MKRHRLLSSLLISVILAGHTGWVGVAMAEVSPSPSASPVISETLSPSPTPSESPSNSPSPSMSPSDSPSPSVPAALVANPTAPTAPSPSTGAGVTGPDQPTGAIPDWVFDDAAQKWVEADKSSFAWDKTSGYWLSPKYYYDKRVGWYKIVPAGSPAASAEYMITAPGVIHTLIGDVVPGSASFEQARSLGLIDAAGNAVGMAATGPGSNNQASISNAGTGWIDMTSLVNVLNLISSSAKTGNAAVSGNTVGGDATSGNASVVANIINLLASAWSWSAGNLATFIQDIWGDQTGDITLAPTQTTTTGGGGMGGSVTNSNTGPGSNNQGTIDSSADLKVNAKDKGSITNDVNLSAASGGASVSGNTKAGDARTGDATAQANIINLISSLINSGSSFFGMLNIHGNLNGDILFPNGFLDSALSGASGGNQVSTNGTGPGSNNTGTINNDAALNLTGSATQAINNNVNANAGSGSASVAGNTAGGNATSGSASTDSSAFNFTNSSLFGDNAVLVVVNVMGHWLGKIMTLPGGGSSTSALLTGNAVVGNNATGPGSNNQGTINNSTKADINASTDGTITNNVNLGAQSGNADVSSNTQAGNATSGNAKATSSVANFLNSAINVKKWFGVLIINVFGDWTGSVNDNTAAGNTLVGGKGGVSAPQLGATLGSLPAFVATSGPTTTSYVNAAPTAQVSLTTGDDGQVLTAAAHQAPTNATTLATKTNSMNLLLMTSLILALFGGALMSIERKLRP